MNFDQHIISLRLRMLRAELKETPFYRKNKISNLKQEIKVLQNKKRNK